MTEELSTNKTINYIPIAAILAGVIFAAFTAFVSFGTSVKAGFEADNVNGGDLAFFIITTIALLLTIVPAILLVIKSFYKRETPKLDITINILTMIALVLFIFVLIMLFLLYMDILSGSE